MRLILLPHNRNRIVFDIEKKTKKAINFSDIFDIQNYYDLLLCLNLTRKNLQYGIVRFAQKIRVTLFAS